MKNLVSTSKVKHSFNKADEGQALVLTALALVVLMLMAGLGVDVGYLRYQKEQMQKAADAGAIAGASAFIYSAQWKVAAMADTAANGFADGTKGIVVSVNSPPLSGPNQNKGYVEVIVSQPQPTFFMRVGGFNSLPVSARAVASANASASYCIVALDRTAPQSFKAQGTITLHSDCGIRVDSTSSTAYTDGGGACVVTDAGGIGVVGGVESTQGCSTVPQTGMAHFDDPFARLVEPTPDFAHCMPNGSPSGSATLWPGTYCGGITINGSGANITFMPGLYILAGGGMTINSTAVIHGTGVTFYNTFKSNGTGFRAISINGVSNSSLSAPTSVTDPSQGIEGILFFEDRNAAKNGGGGGATINNTINGGSGSTFDGALYFFSSSLNYDGSSSSSEYSIIVADQIYIGGNATMNDNYSSLADGPPIKSAVLVE